MKKLLAVGICITFLILIIPVNIVHSETSATGGVSQVDDLLATPHQPTAADIQLEWSEVPNATHYNVYRSTSVRGTGFNFSSPYAIIPAEGDGKIIWIDTGAYVDSSNYSWIVRSANLTEENTDVPMFGGNMAFKLVYTIKIGTGVVTPSLNYIALPFMLNITSGMGKNNAAALMADMRAYGSPANSMQSIARWNLDVGIWETRISFAGKNFPLTPGEGYRITPTVPLVVYKIVGAHNESANLFNLRIGAGAVTPSLNYIALPYHFDIVISLYTNDAKALRTHIRTYGNPAYSISSVGRWDSDTGLWQVVSISGNFALLPGEAYRIPPTAPLVQWHCPVAVPGP